MISLAQLIPLAIALAWLFTIPARGESLATVSGTSDSGAIAWSVNPANGDLMLVRAVGTSTSSKLCDTINPAHMRVEFSPDDKYVFVSDGGPKKGFHSKLYRRGSGLSYGRVSDIDFDAAVQKLAMEVLFGRKVSGEVLDHSHLICTGWSKDGRRAILQLSGRGVSGGKKIAVDKFTCSYDPANKVLSTVR